MPRITKKQIEEQKKKEELIKKWNSFTEEHLKRCIDSLFRCITGLNESIDLWQKHINQEYDIERNKEDIIRDEKKIKKYEEELKIVEDIYIKRFGYKPESLYDPKIKEQNFQYLYEKLRLPDYYFN